MKAMHAGCRTLMGAVFCLLAVPAGPTIWAQTASPAPKLVISILEGEGALNDIRQRTAREPIVQVEDENHKPIAGAAVVFLLPGTGPSGTFADGTQMFSTVTDAMGKAYAQGLRPNSTPGSYDIQVKVNYQGSTAQTTIHQRNVSGQSSSSSTETTHVAHALSMKSILIIAGTAVAAGTVAAIVATQGGSSTTITPGTPTVGAPTATVRLRFSLGRH